MYKEIGHNLRNRRLDLGMTVEDICTRLGISRATWYRYEAGKVDSLTPAEITRIARALHVDSLKLLGFDEDFYESYLTPQPPLTQEQLTEQTVNEYAAQGIALQLNPARRQITPPIPQANLIPDEAHIDEEIIKLFADLTPQEASQVKAFAAGLKAARKP